MHTAAHPHLATLISGKDRHCPADVSYISALFSQPEHGGKSTRSSKLKLIKEEDTYAQRMLPACQDSSSSLERLG
jgi:hypothetical protein